MQRDTGVCSIGRRKRRFSAALVFAFPKPPRNEIINRSSFPMKEKKRRQSAALQMAPSRDSTWERQTSLISSERILPSLAHRLFLSLASISEVPTAMNGSGNSKAKRRRRWPIWLIGIIVVLAVALAANTLRVDAQTRPAAPRDGGSIIETGIEPANVKIEGEGPAILMIHGFGAALDWWDEIAPSVAAHHRVIRLDLIGHGGTAAPTTGYEITRQAQLASAVLDKLKVDRLVVIGHSMGGVVAVALAELGPERIEKLILIDSPPSSDAKFDLVTGAYLSPVIGEVLSHLLTDRAIHKQLAQAFAPKFAVPDKFVADIRQLTYPAFRQAHNESLAYRTSKSTSDRLAALRLPPPSLAIFGSLDVLVPPENAKYFERVPGARIEVIEGVGHSPMVEAPAQTLKLIEGFLN
jgi:pimeloyl-ACP methyl ester carboxylesterase